MQKYLFAGVVGLVLGVLWAPKKGSELRQDLRELFEDGASEALTSGNQILSNVKEHGEDLLDEAENRYAQVSERVDRARVIATQSISKFGEDVNSIKTNNSDGTENS